jgi:hypothetical protein
MARQPFNPDAQTKEELEASRTTEFFDIELRALKGGTTDMAGAMGVRRLTIDEQHLLDQYVKLHQKLGNTHVEGYDQFG